MAKVVKKFPYVRDNRYFCSEKNDKTNIYNEKDYNLSGTVSNHDGADFLYIAEE